MAVEVTLTLPDNLKEALMLKITYQDLRKFTFEPPSVGRKALRPYVRLS